VSEFKSLKILDLSNNHVEGKIPEGVGSLGNLEVLNLGNNLLSGSVPNVLGSSSTATLNSLSRVALNLVAERVLIADVPFACLVVMVVCELSSQMFSFKGDVDSEELEPTLDTILEFLLSLVMMCMCLY
ncbi:probably inactive leucine-rich repeat receptor-like protein kinase, partial [Tanacetum coccineum]